MKYKEAKCSESFPELTEEERTIFLRLLANLDEHIVYVYNGKVMELTDQRAFSGATAYLVNWKWDPIIFMTIAKGLANPDPAFVNFISDYVVRVGLFEYEDTGPHRLEFEEAMSGTCSLTRSAGQDKFAFRAELAFQAWVKAHNRRRMVEDDTVED